MTRTAATEDALRRTLKFW